MYTCRSDVAESPAPLLAFDPPPKPMSVPPLLVFAAVLNHISSENVLGAACLLFETIIPLAPSRVIPVSVSPEMAPGRRYVTPPPTMPESFAEDVSAAYTPDASSSRQ